MFKALAVASALALSLAAPAGAQGAEAAPEDPVITEAGEHTLDEFLWQYRLLVVFADSPNDPNFVQQLENIEERLPEFVERDVIVITDTDPAAKSPIRLELRPRGFGFVLIGKDGSKYLRKSSPWDVREITRSIDKMPLRQQELRDERAGN
jgi:hypothetical protein